MEISDDYLPSYVYTYPTKAAYSPFSDWKAAASGFSEVEGKINLYIHIPFCEMKCAFCNLFTVTKNPRSTIERYIHCLLKEMELMSPFLQLDKLKIQSVYFGGGTPTLLKDDDLSLLNQCIQDTFNIEEDAEWSIEGAPNSFTSEKFKHLKKIGFNRVSLGIQTFDPKLLQAVKRDYESTLGTEMAKKAIDTGFTNVNLDLIYGLPGQSLEGWVDDLSHACKLSPATLTLYPLAVRNRTLFGKKEKEEFLSPRELYRWYDISFECLEKNGYVQKTFVTYAKSTGGCRHEAQQFLGIPTLSFGAGSRKYAPYIHYVDEDYHNRLPHATTLKRYMEAIEQENLIVSSAAFLTKEDRFLQKVILGILSSGINDPGIYLREMQQLIKEGLASETASGFILTKRGMRHSSAIAQWLMEQAHALV
jgi:oxygen-independent coproporphyrinogen-3 oxidase